MSRDVKECDCLFVLLSVALFYRETTLRTPRQLPDTAQIEKVNIPLFVKIAFLKKLSPFLNRLTKDLKRLTQYLTKFTHFEVYFAVPPAKFSHLYTLHFTPYTLHLTVEKSHFKVIFLAHLKIIHYLCTRNSTPGDVCTLSAEGSRHI